jgi:hypothetical protein
MHAHTHTMDKTASIEVDGAIVGKVLVDDGEDRPVMDTMQTRGAGSDASRHP